MVFGLAVAVLAVVGCSNQASSPTAKATIRASAAVSPAPTGLTAQQKAQVQAVLTASMAHYSGLLDAGKQALGSTQYADASAGLAAFSDPNSAASRFGAWRTSSRAEQDISSDSAFNQAVANYTAENQPDAITNWQADMVAVQSDLSAWVQIAVKWQIREATSDQLAGAEQKVRSDLQAAQGDLGATLAAS